MSASEFVSDSPPAVQYTDVHNPRHQQHPALPMAEVGLINRRAQLRGTSLGIGGGILSGR